MRFPKLVFAPLCLICLCSASFSRQVTTETMLRGWVGKNINNLPEKQKLSYEKFANKLLDLVSNNYSSLWYLPDPLTDPDQTGFVWQFSERSKSTFLVYLCTDGPVTPSASSGWTFILNQQGKILDHAKFDLGWRMYPKAAQFVKVNWLSSQVIVQEMVPEVHGDGPRKVFIAFDQTEPVLVRIEDENGKLYRMNHFASNWIVGPLIRNRSKIRLLNALNGKNEARRLEALIWMGGRHIEEDRGSPDRQKGEDFELVQRLLKDADVRAELLRLRGDKNSYVRELAKLVPIGK